ncbi:SCP2 sterol-binding domain-containing protein [Aquabacterium sp.]|uniref:SCP2 sterol-binding domain-containing protein n=1 Tax=Aquabacterium sp. TaxID=1872578 RepID=UPI003783E851
MDLQACTEALRGKVGEQSGLGAVLKFDCGADGVVLIDGKSIPNTVSNTDGPADCTVAITLENLNALLTGALEPVTGFMTGENLNALLTGALEPVTGFMTGRFKVSGDMSVAMKLQRVV